MRKCFSGSYKHLCLTLLLSFIFMLTACSSSNAGDSGISSVGSTATPKVHSTATGNAGTPTVNGGTPSPVTAATVVAQSGAQPCPTAVSDPSHWDPIIPAQGGISQVGLVNCANLIGSSSLQAL